MSKRVVVPARQADNRFLGSLKSLQIRAQYWQSNADYKNGNYKGRQIDKQKYQQTDRKVDREMIGMTDRQADRQTHRQRDRIDRQTDRRTAR